MEHRNLARWSTVGGGLRLLVPQSGLEAFKSQFLKYIIPNYIMLEFISKMEINHGNSDNSHLNSKHMGQLLRLPSISAPCSIQKLRKSIEIWNIE